MDNKKTSFWGYALMSAWLVGMLALGMTLPRTEPVEYDPGNEEDLGRITPTSNPMFLRDQYTAQRLIKERDDLKEEKKRLDKIYSELEPFDPPASNKITQEHIDTYQRVYRDYVRQRKYFKNNVVRSKPSFFSLFPLVGLIPQVHEAAKKNALTKEGVTEREFFWIADKIFMAALYSVVWELDNETHGQKTTEHLEDLKKYLMLHTGIMEYNYDEETSKDQPFIMHPEKMDLDSVPRQNIRVFLENYKELNYSRMHFDRPTQIEFNKEGILRVQQRGHTGGGFRQPMTRENKSPERPLSCL